MSDSRGNRILYVHNSADLYGASRSLLRLVPRMKSRGWNVQVLVPEDGPLKQRLESFGVKVDIDPALSIITRTTFKSWRLLLLVAGFVRSVARLRRRIRAERIDLVHTNSGVIFSPALAARLAGVPHVWHVRESFEEFRSLWKPYSSYMLACSRRIIAVSGPTAAQFPASPKVTVVHNGADLDEFALDSEAARARFRGEHGLGNLPVVGCIGRIKFVRKGQEVLVEAAKRIKDSGFQAKYLIVGSTAPGYEDHLVRLRELIQRLGLQEDVILAGELSDVRAAYAAMDIFVLPSAQPEPFGGVVLEAMALKLPVIATAIGGSIEQVEDGVTGYLIPPADSAAMADRVKRLLEDPELRVRMGHAGRERLARRFSIGEMLNRIEGVYRDAGLLPESDP